MSAPRRRERRGTAVLSPAAARRVFYILTWTRWFPVGLVAGVFTLVALQRGLSVQEVLSYGAAQGIVVLLLELPTSGFADAFGRRPLLVVAGFVNIVAGLLYLRADSFAGFALAAAVMGIYRALDSGPLDAWFVDTVHRSEPGADVDGALARQGSMLGLAISLGALCAGGLIAWHPVAAYSPLALPLALYTALGLVHVCVLFALMHEPLPADAGKALTRALASARDTPAVVRDGLRLVLRNRVLRALVVVEVFTMAAMVVFENFQPIRLAELLGSEDRAGAFAGPITAAGWLVFAAGSALAGWLTPRIGVARTAMVARVANGLGAAVMGLTAGPVALVAAYLVTYGFHGTSGAPHYALLHREASAQNRATILSVNSMVFFAASSVMGPALGWLAERTSTQTGMVAGGLLSIIGVLFYLPALHAERTTPPVASA